MRLSYIDEVLLEDWLVSVVDIETVEKHVGIGEDRESGLLEIKDIVLDGVEMKANPVKTWLDQMEGVYCFLDEDPCTLV